MNRWLLHKVYRSKYRKYALRISMGVHVIMIIVYALFFIQTEVSVIEDEIEVEFIKELPQIIKKQPMPILKKEIPEPKIEMPKKRDVQKQVKVIKPKQSMETGKMSVTAPKPIDIDESATEQVDIEAPPLLETPDLSTDADLTPTPASVLSSIPLNIGNTPGKKYGRRKSTGVATPGKGTGNRNHIEITGAAPGNDMNGISAINGTGNGSGGTGNGSGGTGNGSGGTGNDEGNSKLSSMEKLANDIIKSSKGNPIDVVFVVDRSGSMRDSIRSVVEHLADVIDAYKASEMDYMLGLTIFYARRYSRKTAKNEIRILRLTRNLSAYKREFSSIRGAGDENVLDAIHQTVTQMQFRTDSMKHLILVTDEMEFTSIQKLTLDSVIKLCQRNKIYVNVLGNNHLDHKRIAEETGGTWHPIPIKSTR